MNIHQQLDKLHDILWLQGIIETKYGSGVFDTHKIAENPSHPLRQQILDIHHKLNRLLEYLNLEDVEIKATKKVQKRKKVHAKL